MSAPAIDSAALLGQICDALELPITLRSDPQAILGAVQSSTRMARTSSTILHNLTVSCQAAWIEQHHGGGAEKAMDWIEGALSGPGVLPGEFEDDISEDDPVLKDAEGYYDRYCDDFFKKDHPSKLAAKLRQAKTDSELLDFVNANRTTIRFIEFKQTGGDLNGSFHVGLEIDPTMWRILGHGPDIRQAIGAAVVALDPQADLFAAEKGGA